jgi:hypothetical protein
MRLKQHTSYVLSALYPALYYLPETITSGLRLPILSDNKPQIIDL